jgi:hypothetical protein
MMHPGVETRVCSLDQAMGDAEILKRDDACWIFHIGHVGSTLISRLLGELDGVLSIREPRSLRDLIVATIQDQAKWGPGVRRLMSRTFGPGQVALVKATSFVSEIAPVITSPTASALFLFATPVNFIASILAGENSIKELGALDAIRRGRLRRRGIDLAGFDRSNAHRAALAWACEMTSLESAAEEMSDRHIYWADFDRMLEDMAGWVERCAAEFGFPARRSRIEEIVGGPLMRRYSKALEYDYSPSLRADLLAEAARQHEPDIKAAVAALANAAMSTPLLARALERAERES